MPNPFFRGITNTSKRPTRPEPITPVMEQYSGENNAWRGIEDHGVTPEFDSADPITSTVDVNGRPTPITYEDPEKIADPIPVRIVQSGSREYRVFWTDRVTLKDMPTEIIGRDDDRSSVTILNTDAAKTIWIANDQTELVMRGYPLGPGKEKTIGTEMPIYAIATDSSAVVVGVIVEKSIQERHK